VRTVSSAAFVSLLCASAPKQSGAHAPVVVCAGEDMPYFEVVRSSLHRQTSTGGRHFLTRFAVQLDMLNKLTMTSLIRFLPPSMQMPAGEPNPLNMGSSRIRV
jgi:hypothetical protein